MSKISTISRGVLISKFWPCNFYFALFSFFSLLFQCSFFLASPSDARMECCEVEPRYTIEQIDLLQRLRLSGLTKPQIVHALESLERLDSDHRPAYCEAHATPASAPAAAAAAAPSSSSSSLTSTTTQTPNLDTSPSPSNSYEASPPPQYPASGGQRSFSYDMPEEDWDVEEKVEEYMR